MADSIQWEYRVQSFGTIMREVKDAELNKTINAWGEEGWEVVSAVHTNGNKITVVAKRPLELSERRRRSWPA